MELCHADSAGISLLEPGGENGLFRWQAIVGGLAGYLGGTVPREANLCGVVIARDSMLLFREAARFFPGLRDAEPRIFESLVAPWHVKGEAVGALWAIQHTPDGRFDAEDARLLQSLARFAAAAHQMTTALHEAKTGREALEQRVQERTRALADAHESVQKSEARLRAALEIETVGVIYLDLEGRIIDANNAFLAMGGYSRADLEAGRLTWQELTPPEWMEASEKAVAELKTTGQTTPYEKEYLRKDGSRWCGLFAAKLLPDGTIFEFVLDITARKQVEQALAAELKAMTRLHDVSRQVVDGAGLQVVLDAILDATIELHGADFGNIQLYDEKTRTLRLAVQRGFQEPFLDRFAEVSSEEGSACGMALARQERVMIEDVEQEPAYAASLTAAREAGYRAVQSTPLFTPAGTPLGMLSTHFRQPHRLSERELRFTDIYARQASDAIAAQLLTQSLRESEGRAKLLLAELQHRVRNTLSVIRSIIRRTAQTSKSVEDYAMHLDGRINAFARVQTAVARDPGAGLDLTQLVADELLACAAHEGEQVRMVGPSVRLQPKAAETFGLAVHELATNALKYGSLSRPHGRIRITWQVQNGGEAPRLVFEWKESGMGEPVAKQRQQGFGAYLLERTLTYELKAKTVQAFEPDGLHCTIELPLTKRISMDNFASTPQQD
ncbi:GAF domain-containing protein [Microvirga massiliensis]|uniref:GAF domain-containing protein n=1 Tax=Microvirga massiliensis TaxID=1033741 RepID=UPI003CC7D8E8